MTKYRIIDYFGKYMPQEYIFGGWQNVFTMFHGGFDTLEEADKYVIEEMNRPVWNTSTVVVKEYE